MLLVALVYVAYPFISTVPAFFSELRTANWWWALLGLAVSALTYVGAAAALWACADGLVSFRNLVIMQVANTFAATTTPAGVGGLALSTRFLQKGGLGALRATAAVALQQTVQVITHVALLIFFSAAAGASADLSHFVPSATLLYLIAGVVLGLVGAFLFVPKLRRWLATAVRPRLKEVLKDLAELAREPKRLGIIVLGCAATTLGMALALWASIEAFGGARVVRHGDRRDDGRRNPRLGGPDARRSRCGRGGTDRRSRRIRRPHRDRRAVGAALPRADLLAARVHRLADHALAHRQRHDLRFSETRCTQDLLT